MGGGGYERNGVDKQIFGDMISLLVKEANMA